MYIDTYIHYKKIIYKKTWLQLHQKKLVSSRKIAVTNFVTNLQGDDKN